MNNLNQNIDMGFTQERFPDCTHMCVIFDNDEQCQEIVSAYLAAGLRHGELVRYAVDTTLPEQVRARLLDLGIQVPDGEPFSVLEAKNFYYSDGYFDADKMIDRMPSRYESARQAGYSAVRSCGEMSWAGRGVPGSESLLRYEALLNTVPATLPHIGMCLYDARLFDGATLFKMLQVHPYMVAHGQIVRNPYYLKSE